MSKSNIVCYGEVLWDLLPKGKVAGGAPMNVAHHLQNFEIDTTMISEVGDDDLGKELLGFLKNNGINTDLVQTNFTFPTGIVNVELDAKGSPTYDIVMPVAWDFINTNNEKVELVRSADALVFGSLACRSERSMQTLLDLAEVAKFRVLDVNLRTPFYSQDLIEKLLGKADLIKLSDEELEIIGAWYIKDVEEKKALDYLSSKFNLETVILTKGSEGALCLQEGKLYEHASFPITVKDTIGSGDSFLAAFLSKKFKGENPDVCLRFACATGALVATHSGGTPKIDEQAVVSFINSN